MCGICGQFNYDDPRPVDREPIERMTETLRHRGPDDVGYHFSGPVGLGFRRLSIIDLEGGHQPMSDAQGQVWVLLNGEIYNYPELRHQLESLGHLFRTRSDTEVIVHGYRQWGFGVLSRLNGMFGLALWDERRQKLILARDRLGIKPLYYGVAPGRLYFGSEIRALLENGPEDIAVDPRALSLFLRFRYCPSPFTALKGIKKLAPGTALIAGSGALRVERWWDFRPEPFDPMPRPEEAAEELASLYRSAVKRHLLADVPLGLFLSGGVDSALLLALIQETGTPCPCFTVGYGREYAEDELEDATQTAAFFEAPLKAVRLTRGEFEQTLPRVVEALEEPVASPSVVPMYALSRRVREDVKVALIGQGPDELFGGYRRHLGVRYGEHWRGLPVWIRGGLRGLLSALPRGEALRRGLRSLDVPGRMQRYAEVFSLLPEATVGDLFLDGSRASGAAAAMLECWQPLEPLMSGLDELGGFQLLELRSSLPDELLMYADKLSMAHALEVRVPYLDHEVVEFVEQLPSAYKVRATNRKWLHKRVCARYLPARIIRRRKRGFAVDVVDRWFRDSLNGLLENTLLEPESLLYSLFSFGKIRQLVEEHRSGRSDHHKIIYSLVFTEMWLRSLRQRKPLSVSV